MILNGSYGSEPTPVEAHRHGGITDVILRTDIKRVETETEEEPATEWRCKEVQLRLPGSISEEEATEQFFALWKRGETGEEPKTVTLEERVTAAEAALLAIMDMGVNLDG